MPKKTKSKEIPERVEFEIEKSVVRVDVVTIKEATEDSPAVKKEVEILKSQDEAMEEALAKAKEMGYTNVSLQDYTPTGYLFLAYGK